MMDKIEALSDERLAEWLDEISYHFDRVNTALPIGLAHPSSMARRLRTRCVQQHPLREQLDASQTTAKLLNSVIDRCRKDARDAENEAKALRMRIEELEAAVDAEEKPHGMPWRFWAEKSRELANKNEALIKVLRGMQCPSPYSHHPDGLSVKGCSEAGECNCGAAQAIAPILTPHQ